MTIHGSMAGWYVCDAGKLLRRWLELTTCRCDDASRCGKVVVELRLGTLDARDRRWRWGSRRQRMTGQSRQRDKSRRWCVDGWVTGNSDPDGTTRRSTRQQQRTRQILQSRGFLLCLWFTLRVFVNIKIMKHLTKRMAITGILRYYTSYTVVQRI